MAQIKKLYRGKPKEMRDEEKTENKHSEEKEEKQEDCQDDKEEEDLDDKRDSGNEAEEDTLVPDDVVLLDKDDQGDSDDFLKAEEVCISFVLVTEVHILIP